MGDKAEIGRGGLALMVLKTPGASGPQHGHGHDRRTEQTRGDAFSVKYGTPYPEPAKREGFVSYGWGVSDSNRSAEYDRPAPAGRKQLSAETRGWVRAGAVLARFFTPAEAS